MTFLADDYFYLYVNFEGPKDPVPPTRAPGTEDKEEAGAEALRWFA